MHGLLTCIQIHEEGCDRPTACWENFLVDQRPYLGPYPHANFQGTGARICVRTDSSFESADSNGNATVGMASSADGS